jgi:hypothetical protein
MKCALELQMIAKARVEENRKKEELTIRKHTLRECERIGDFFENQAEKGENVCCYKFYIDKTGQKLKETRTEYTDHRRSYISTGLKIDIDIMREWFKPYCFNVEIQNFNYYKYGFGELKGYIIYIRPFANCLN